MTLKNTKPGDHVISNEWPNFEWRNEPIPRDLVVIKHVGDDCVQCKPTDGLSEETLPLFAGLTCRRVIC